jgi:hypothetical protein
MRGRRGTETEEAIAGAPGDGATDGGGRGLVRPDTYADKTNSPMLVVAAQARTPNHVMAEVLLLVVAPQCRQVSAVS